MSFSNVLQFLATCVFCSDLGRLFNSLLHESSLCDCIKTSSLCKILIQMTCTFSPLGSCCRFSSESLALVLVASLACFSNALTVDLVHVALYDQSHLLQQKVPHYHSLRKTVREPGWSRQSVDVAYQGRIQTPWRKHQWALLNWTKYWHFTTFSLLFHLNVICSSGQKRTFKQYFTATIFFFLFRWATAAILSRQVKKMSIGARV